MSKNKPLKWYELVSILTIPSPKQTCLATSSLDSTPLDTYDLIGTSAESQNAAGTIINLWSIHRSTKSIEQ